MLTLAFALGVVSQPMQGKTQGGTLALKMLHMVDAQTGWAYLVGYRAGGSFLARTTSGGTQWVDITPISSGRKIGVHKIFPLTQHTAWISPSTAGEIFRTTDGGRTWKGVTIAPPGWAVTVDEILFINPREGRLLAEFGVHTGHTDVGIYRSTDGGETWVELTNNKNANSGLMTLSGITGMTFRNSTAGWITGNSIPWNWLYLYATNDGGLTWQERKLPLPPQLTPRWISSLQQLKFFTTQDGIMRALFRLYRADIEETESIIVFYVTHDGGTTWDYTTPIPVKKLYPLPSQFFDMDNGWLKEEGTLYVTRDGGHGWAKIPPNELIADVTQLAFVSPEVGWAVRDTFPGGGGTPTFPFLLKTLDGGRTWTPVPYTISRP
jgi:photosystem II stability/assembly factor-like uncharacterized protein